MTSKISLEERLVQLLGHLHIERAHFAACMPRDWEGLIANHREVVASLTLLCPMGINVRLLASTALPTLCITGDKGRSAQDIQRAASSLPAASIFSLRDYFSPSWADPALDRGEDVNQAMNEFIRRGDFEQRTEPVSLRAHSGEIAEIAYSICGKGPPLVLLPLALSPSQWEPLIPLLSAQFCTIALSGQHLGMVAHLEARAQSGYMRVVETLVHATGLQPGQSVLEVGCGSGAIVRWLAKRTTGRNPITGADVNRYLLREAAALAQRDGVAQWIDFQEANAEKLPFADNSFDLTICCTVMEEGHADRMLAELTRVTKPAGKIAVVVRSIDMPRWVNLNLSAALKSKAEAPGFIGGNVTAEGCADMSLYRRMHSAALVDVIKMPQWASHHEGERLQYMEDRIAAALEPSELSEWRAAIVQTQADNSFFIAEPFHCAVGTKS